MTYAQIITFIRICMILLMIICIVICIFSVVLIYVYHFLDIKPSQQNHILQFFIKIFGMYHLSHSEIANEIFYKIHNIYSPQSKMIYIAGYSDYVFLHDHNKEAYISMLMHGDATFIEIRKHAFLDLDTYSRIFHLMKYYKPVKPVSAYILHIDIDDLHDIQEEKLHHIYHRLSIASRTVSLPIYLLITGLESISEFHEVSQYIEAHDSILGWADNVEDIFSNVKYSINNIDHTYNKIAHDLYMKFEKLSFRITARENGKCVSMFPDKVISKIRNLSMLLNKIFGNHSVYFLRGIYFSGKINDKIVGLNTLLLKHIALEELGKYKQSQYQVSKHIQNALYIIIIILYCMLFMRYVDRCRIASKLVHDVSRIKSFHTTKLTQQSMTDFAIVIHNIQSSILHHWMMPLSYLKSPFYRIQEIIGYIYYKFIICTVYNKFNAALHALKHDKTHNIFEYIESVLELFKIYQSLSKIDNKHTLSNLSNAMCKLFKIEVSKQYNDYYEIYTISRKYKTFSLDDMHQASGVLSKILIHKMHIFTKEFIQFADLFKKIDQLQHKLEIMQERPDKYSIHALQNIYSILCDIEHIFHNHIKDWIMSSNIDNNPQFVKCIASMKECSIFSAQTIQHISHYIQHELSKAKANLSIFQISSIGALCDMHDNQIKLSSVFMQFKHSIYTLLDQLQKLKEDNNNKRNIQISSYIWNISKLQSTYQVLTEFNLEELLQLVPVQPRQSIKTIMHNILQAYIYNAIENSIIEYSEQRSIEYISQNIMQSLEVIDHILKICDVYHCTHSKEHILSILKKQIDHLYAKILLELESHDMYNPAHIANSVIHAKMQMEHHKAIVININKLVTPIMQVYKRYWMSHEWCDAAFAIQSINNALSSGQLDSLERSIEIYQSISPNSLKTCLDAYQYVQQHHQNQPLYNFDFIQKKQHLAIKCIQSKIDQIIQDHVKIIIPNLTKAFNSVKDFFPFAGNTAPDMPDNVFEDFYNTWKQNRDNIRCFLQMYDKTQKIDDWYTFIYKLEKCMRWFESSIEPNQFYSKIVITNRVNKSAELNIRYLKSWDIEFAYQHINTICSINSSSTIENIHHNCITISQQLAKNSNAYFTNGHQTATLNYKGKYAILRFILSHLSKIKDQRMYLCFKNTMLLNNATDSIVGWCALELQGHIKDTIEGDYLSFRV